MNEFNKALYNVNPRIRYRNKNNDNAILHLIHPVDLTVMLNPPTMIALVHNFKPSNLVFSTSLNKYRHCSRVPIVVSLIYDRKDFNDTISVIDKAYIKYLAKDGECKPTFLNTAKERR